MKIHRYIREPFKGLKPWRPDAADPGVADRLKADLGGVAQANYPTPAPDGRETVHPVPRRPAGGGKDSSGRGRP